MVFLGGIYDHNEDWCNLIKHRVKQEEILSPEFSKVPKSA